MHGLPDKIDLKFLEEKELTQVCIDQHEVILNFHEELSLTIMSRCVLEASNGEVTEVTDFQKSAAVLTRLLGAKTVHETHQTDGKLTLTFSTRDTLTVFDDQPNYESYVISYGQDVIGV